MTDTQYAILSWSLATFLIVMLTAVVLTLIVYLWAFMQVTIIFLDMMSLGGSNG